MYLYTVILKQKSLFKKKRKIISKYLVYMKNNIYLCIVILKRKSLFKKTKNNFKISCVYEK